MYGKYFCDIEKDATLVEYYRNTHFFDLPTVSKEREVAAPKDKGRPDTLMILIRPSYNYPNAPDGQVIKVVIAK